MEAYSLLGFSNNSVIGMHKALAILSNVSSDGVVLPFTMLLVLGWVMPMALDNATTVIFFSFKISLILSIILPYQLNLSRKYRELSHARICFYVKYIGYDSFCAKSLCSSKENTYFCGA